MNEEHTGNRLWSRRGVLATGTLLAALRSGAHAQQRAVYLSDFSQCRPSEALSRTPKRHRWRLLDYASDKTEGVMLVAGHNTAAPEITLPLNRKGWHAIHFGLRSRYGESRLEARLNSDSTFTLITHNDVVGQKQNRKDYEIRATNFDTGTRIDDLFWKVADLTTEELVLRQFCPRLVPENEASVANSCFPLWLAYVKLTPLSEQEVEQLQADRRRRDTRRLYAHNDAWGYVSWLRPSTRADIRRELEPYRDTDFARIYWEAGAGDRMFYPTKIGLTAADDWIRDPFRVRDRLAAESYRAFREKGIDHLRVAAEHAHQVGLEFHASYRVAGFHFPVPEDEWNTGGLYHQHPEWRGRNRHGRPTPRLSYAYAGVRQYVLSLFREIAAYPIDGICLLYNRRPPLVEYEEPIVKGFEEQYGEDAHKLDERDPRWLKYRATFLTQFMREVREMLDDEARRQGRKRPFEVSAIVMGTEQANLYYAMDLEEWIREGLVDTLVPYTSTGSLNSGQDTFVDPGAAEYFLRITRGTSCKAAASLLPRQITPEDYRRRAHGLYQAGVENLFFWDCYQRCDYSRSWTTLRRLGHREEIADWVRAGAPAIQQSGATLHKLGDWDLRYDTPG